MIEAVRVLQYWMAKYNIDQDGVEMTIHFPDESRYSQFMNSLKLELDAISYRNLAAPLSGIKLLGMRIHMRAGKQWTLR